MWKDIGEASQLVLGIAIALYTLYEFATRYLERPRQRQTLVRTLHGELSSFLALAGSLAKRAEQAVDALPGYEDETGFPNPAKEKDSMPESAVPLAAWLVDRAERLAEYRISRVALSRASTFSVDVELIGAMKPTVSREPRRAQGMPLAQAVVDAGAVRFRPMLLTAAALVVGASVILFDPIFQGLALSLMAGEVVSTLRSRMAVPRPVPHGGETKGGCSCCSSLSPRSRWIRS